MLMFSTLAFFLFGCGSEEPGCAKKDIGMLKMQGQSIAECDFKENNPLGLGGFIYLFSGPKGMGTGWHLSNFTCQSGYSPSFRDDQRRVRCMNDSKEILFSAKNDFDPYGAVFCTKNDAGVWLKILGGATSPAYALCDQDDASISLPRECPDNSCSSVSLYR